MKFQFRTVSVIIYASLIVSGDACLGQTGPPVTTPAASPSGDTLAAAPVPAKGSPSKGPNAPAASATKSKGSPTETAPAAPVAKAYVIGPLDVLQITVWNDARLSGMFDVDPDGMIPFPLIDRVKADGLTLIELQHLLRERLSAPGSVFTEPPDVNVQLLRINSKKYYVFGSVNHSGEFPLTGDMTVLDAFASCGGFKEFANLTKIRILRGNQTLKFNYKDVSHGKHMEQNYHLQNGDRIFVDG